MKTTGTAMWAFTKTPDSKFEPCWRINLLITDEEAKKLKEIGLKPKRNDDGVFEFKLKRNVERKKGGGQNPPPQVFDAQLNPFDGLIGNGSKVNVKFSVYNWEFKGKKGTSADLQAIQIVELVPYEGSSRADDNEGFEPVGKEESKKVEDKEDW